MYTGVQKLYVHFGRSLMFAEPGFHDDPHNSHTWGPLFFEASSTGANVSGLALPFFLLLLFVFFFFLATKMMMR